jgi:hypothetical protein
MHGVGCMVLLETLRLLGFNGGGFCKLLEFRPKV